MPRRNDDFMDIPSIVPDTEARSEARTKPVPRQAPARSPNSTAPAASSGLIRQGLTMVALLGLGGACGYLYLHHVQQTALNQQLMNRITTMESQLGVANSPADQPAQGETLGSKVKSLDENLKAANDEIRKLWGITNDRNRKSLDSHETRITEQQKEIDSLKTALTEARKSLAQAEKASSEASRTATEIKSATGDLGAGLSEMRNSVGSLQQRIAQGDPVAREASQQAALAQEQAEQVQAKLDALSRKVAEHDDSLRGIDTFRRSVNSDLNKLKGVSGGGYSQPY